MTDSASPAVARYAELTYSSGARGFQVLETRGALSEDEREALVARIATGADFGIGVPDFPTADEVACLPRKLVYAPVAPFGFAFWHTVPAGRDQSDRPGNVFAHVVLDRCATGVVDPARPIEGWQSARWLRPFGAAEVAAAHLQGPDHDGPGGLISRGAVVKFLLDPARRRVDLMAVLLDAVLGALSGGSRVVLGVESVDNAVVWIGAVSYVMSPGTARRFGWSVHERPATVVDAFHRGCHLVCVPRCDLADLAASMDLVVIDEGGKVEVGQWPDNPHRESRGVEVPCSAWSETVKALLLLDDDPAAALQEVDWIAGQVADHDLDPVWPTAMLVAQDIDMYHEAVPAAREVIATASPESLRDAPTLMASALQLVTLEMGGSAADAWLALTAASTRASTSVVVEMLWETYMARAVVDRQRLCGAEPQPHGAVAMWPHGHVTIDRAVSEAVAQVRHENGVDPSAACLWAARLADFVLTADGHRSAEAEAALICQLQNLLEQTRLPSLLMDGSELLRRIGYLQERTLADVVRPVFETATVVQRAPLGRRVPPCVLAWLYPRGLRGLVGDAALTYDNPPSVLDLELAITVSGSEPTTEHRDAARFVALRAVGTPACGHASTKQILSCVQVGQAIPLAEVVECLRHRGAQLPARMIAESLVCGSPADAEHRLIRSMVTDLGKEYVEADRCGQDPDVDLLFNTIDLFDLAAETSWNGRSIDELSWIAKRVTNAARLVSEQEHVLPPITVAHVRAALAIQHSVHWAMSTHQHGDSNLLASVSPSAEVDDARVSSSLVGEFLARAMDENRLDAIAGVARLAMVGRGGFPAPVLSSPVAAVLAGSMVASGDSPFLEDALRSLLSQWEKGRIRELEGLLAGDLTGDLRGILTNWPQDETERLHKDAQAFLKSWLKQTSSDGGWIRRRHQAHSKGAKE